MILYICMFCFCRGVLAQGGEASGAKAEEVKAGMKYHIVKEHRHITSHFRGDSLTNKGSQALIRLEYRRFNPSYHRIERNSVRSFARIEATQRADIKIKLGLAESTGKLDLSECEVEEVPEEVFNLIHLEELSLAGNNLTEIPDAIGNLESLEKLQLSGNRLRHLPQNIRKLKNIKGLWLHGNLLETLPEEIGYLKSLQQLAVAGNRLRYIPESIGSLTNLYEFVAAGNSLRDLPDSIGNMASLRVFDLHGNMLDSVPLSIGSLSGLEELWLQGNSPLTQLPDTICSLTKLKKLSVADCSLEIFPDKCIGLTSLEDLSLYSNQLKELPLSMLDAPKLKKVWVEGNPILPTSLSTFFKKAKDTNSLCKVGVDNSQMQDVSGKEDEAIRKQTISSRRIPNTYGYFKLDHCPGVEANAQVNTDDKKLLIVAFGSAPGVPNWGGILKRIRNSLDKDSHGDIHFDVLYVVDPFRSWYGSGDDRMYEYEKPLKEVSSRYEKVVFLGDSMGATASLLFAKYATSVHAFCPQIDLSKSSIRPGEEEEWEKKLCDRLLDGVSKCPGNIVVHVGNWQHDLQQSNFIPPDIQHARVKIYNVNSHRLAIALDKTGKLLPLLQSAILNQLGRASTANVRLSNLF